MHDVEGALKREEALLHVRPRLRSLIDAVAGFDVVADIATDHALVATALVSEGRARRVIAIDKNRAPLHAAARRLQAQGFGESVELRLGDGFGPLAQGEAQAAIIAGVGGRLAARLVAGGVPEGLDTLWLQVNSDHEHLRRTMAEQGWALKDEDLVASEGRVFTNLQYERGPDPNASSWCPRDWRWGPQLRARAEASYWTLRRQEAARVERLIGELGGSDASPRESATARLRQLRAQLAELVDELQSADPTPSRPPKPQ